MNKEMVNRWNSKIGPNDPVYLIGDVSFGTLGSTVSILRSLNGKKYLLAGNHDKRFRMKQAFIDCFEWIKDYHVLYVQDPEAKDGRQMIVLMHFPILSWDSSKKGSWHCHGHSHGNIQDKNKDIKRIDVGVDTNNFYPYSYREIKELMKLKTVNYDV
jgi:calcineurin-like phosphoesterase family protein